MTTKEYRKQTNYANRGMNFEKRIQQANKDYDAKGVAVIDKLPTPVRVLGSEKGMIKGFYESKSTVDFSGTFEGRSITFEAKSVTGKSFPLKNISDHQIKHLQKVSDHGAIAFLLLEFRDMGEVFIVPLDILKDYFDKAANGGRKSIPYNSMELHAYEVKKGAQVPLDYLETARKMEEVKWDG
ncbi:Holliday junction resolvase RecU [Salicibibacter halophilus]|uniref:Holliday junction resolvase RecU n=2 Tax=Salicibibacter halophilus TaxID=2502791 RepID=A0A514LMD1_9BACI|nr:Holliday junction resolvase RecU [Salicibibacter halophilus]